MLHLVTVKDHMVSGLTHYPETKSGMTELMESVSSIDIDEDDDIAILDEDGYIKFNSYQIYGTDESEIPRYDGDGSHKVPTIIKDYIDNLKEE